MGYLDIQSRENIDAIMGETLSGYFRTKVTVSGQYRRGSYILCPRLNAAVYARPERRVKQFMQRSHAARRNVLLQLAMSMFIRVAFSRQGLFGCRYITFEKLPPHAESLLIMPGNMKLKLFDFQTGVITNVLKAGFTDASLELEKGIRLNTDKPYILPLKMEQDNVYTEQLVPGCSFDRLEKHRASAANEEIKKCLLDIQQGNRRIIDAADYLSGQLLSLRQLLEKLNSEKALKKRILSFAEKMGRFSGKQVILSDSHGDFQSGNTFIADDGRVYILDWETFAVRSIGYDLLTFFYKFRYRGDFLMRIDSFLNDIGWQTIAKQYGAEGLTKRSILSVYFIEDIIWLLQETLSTPEKRCSDGIRKYGEPEFQRSVIERLEKCE